MALKGTVEILEHIASELTYIPTPEMRKAKSAFWSRHNDNPICEPQDITKALAIQLSGDGRLSRWWSQEGFVSWFRNRDEFRQRMEYLSNLALDRLEAILADVKANPSAQVNAAKLIMEVARKTPQKSQAETYLDEKVAQMTKPQLEEYIRKSLRLVEPTVPLTENREEEK